MREILFRGKRIDNGEWVYGFYVCIDNKHHYIFTGGKDTSGLYPTFLYHEVDPSTVGQYTGMTDRKGKKIFEGDLLSATIKAVVNKRINDWGLTDYDFEKKTAVWSVEWKVFNARHGFYVYGKDRRFHALLSNSIMINCDCEVIGNIHDNIKLLKGN